MVYSTYFFAVGQDYQEGGQQYNCPSELDPVKDRTILAWKERNWQGGSPGT